MTRHLTEEEIAICADALNSGGYRDLPSHLREHLAQCDECGGEVLMVTEVAGEFDFKAESEKPVKEKAQRIIAWSISIAAAVALILLVIDQEINPLGNDQLISQNSTTEQTIKNTDAEAAEEPSTEEAVTREESIISKKPEPGSQEIPKNSEFPGSSAPTAAPPSMESIPDTLKFLAHYIPDENMEKLVSRFKGNMRDNSDIVIETPVSIKQSQSSVVTIKWQNPDRKKLVIEVFDNKGKQTLETETNEKEYTLSNLNKGLYYWKLISGSDFDLLFCGKITIE
jgi:hypothetical protein